MRLINAINLGKPTDDYVYFMGFCPNADSDNRLDIEWKEKGICTWDYYEDELQTREFNNIWPGDLIVLKKSKNRSEHTMTVHGADGLKR